MINEFIKNVDLPQLFNVFAGVVAFFIAYLQILPLIPRSSSKILSDIEVYKKAKEIDTENYSEIKIAIEREIYRKYKKPTKIYNYWEFFISLIVLIIISYFTYDKIIEKQFDNTFYFFLISGFICLIILRNSFDQPELKKVETLDFERIAVFKFEIFSWRELISGVVVVIIFGLWTYKILFKNGSFEFDWWSILTFSFCFTGIGLLTGAFKKKK